MFEAYLDFPNKFLDLYEVPYRKGIEKYFDRSRPNLTIYDYDGAEHHFTFAGYIGYTVDVQRDAILVSQRWDEGQIQKAVFLPPGYGHKVPPPPVESPKPVIVPKGTGRLAATYIPGEGRYTAITRHLEYLEREGNSDIARVATAFKSVEEYRSYLQYCEERGWEVEENPEIIGAIVANVSGLPVHKNDIEEEEEEIDESHSNGEKKKSYPDVDRIVKYYERPRFTRAGKAGDDAGRVGWHDKSVQMDRFRHLLRLVGSGASILDFGCGLGSMVELVETERSDLKYVGVDINIEFINESRRRHPEYDFRLICPGDPLPSCDWAVASGVFTVHTSTDQLVSCVGDLLAAARVGVAFNVLSGPFVEVQPDDQSSMIPIRGYDPKVLVERLRKEYGGAEYTVFSTVGKWPTEVTFYVQKPQ